MKKTGYLKADQLYYFDKNFIEYKVIAHMDESFLEELLKLIFLLHNENKLKHVFTNLNIKEKNYQLKSIDGFF